ncbi:MAG: polyprenyl synthetase family protein [Actinomycetaceae bacterium]|nr:polyprenyl synthetase family protein [Actinomycetaceae bacterium]
MRFSVQNLDSHLNKILNHWQELWVEQPLLPLLRGGLDLYVFGGKRLRAQGLALGYELFAGTNQAALLSGAAAVELYQASALAHDDIVDNADTRRGKQSLHRYFEAAVRNSSLRQNAQVQGRDLAILAGDLLMSLAFEQAHQAVMLSGMHAASLFFAKMTTEVGAGQFFDCISEGDPRLDDPQVAFTNAMQVITYKSARYSVSAPVIFGALLAGNTNAEALAGVLEPWGRAFQLRDDELGVFGDPTVTGKPAGDDLREGKRTALVALTLQKSQNRAKFLRLLGTELSFDEVHWMRTEIIECGAFAAHEKLIETQITEGENCLFALDIQNKQMLSNYRDRLTKRRY